MRVQRQSNGKLITLETELSSGGEGKIYTVSRDPLLVAKVYHPGKLTPVHGEKLKLMLVNQPDNPTAAQGHDSIAWPADLLWDAYSQQFVVGFLMRRVTEVRPIHDYYNHRTRCKIIPWFHYLYLHRTARNLASAVSALHAKGYVIGDVNESNILVKNNALVTLVDTDSFQVRDPQTGEVYRCLVGKPEFTPPELQGQSFRNVDRSPEHDLFGLAVLIFQLLMEGTHPFDGKFQEKGDPPQRSMRISSGHFPYGSQRVPYLPKRLAPPFEILHPRLQQLFVQCFEDGHKDPKVRPDALTWVRALNEAERALEICSVNKQHWYGGHLDACPWCQRRALLNGQDPFPGGSISTRPKYVPPKLQVELLSEKGVDYTRLSNLLTAGMWFDADTETSDRMLEAMKKNFWWMVGDKDLLNFPGADLRTINSLWLKFSNGKFGFSVQKDIWIEVGGTLTGKYNSYISKKFGERLEWRKKGKWLKYSELTFNTNAKRGHLPAMWNFLVWREGGYGFLAILASVFCFILFFVWSGLSLFLWGLFWVLVMENKKCVRRREGGLLSHKDL